MILPYNPKGLNPLQNLANRELRVLICFNEDFSISLEDELYSKSPNVLSIELRKCYVVYHMLKRHIYFKQLEEAI
jgi:hypothetical protein